MNIEKLIEQLNGYFEGKELGRGAALDAATVLSTFQAENEKLQKMYQEEKVVCHATQVELEKVRESLDFARTKDAEILRPGMELGHLKKHMEKLTHRLGNGEITCNMARDDCRKMGGDCQIDSKILDRLAAYEETDLEPEDIDRILDAYGRGMTLRTESSQRLKIVKDIKTTRLCELAQADKEGRCVVLDDITVADLQQMLSVLDSTRYGDDAETYTTGYRNGHRNGRIEILRHVLGIHEGTSEYTEAALRREQDG